MRERAFAFDVIATHDLRIAAMPARATSISRTFANTNLPSAIVLLPKVLRSNHFPKTRVAHDKRSRGRATMQTRFVHSFYWSAGTITLTAVRLPLSAQNDDRHGGRAAIGKHDRGGYFSGHVQRGELS